MLQILNLDKEDEEIKSPLIKDNKDKKNKLPQLASSQSQSNLNLSADYINTEENEVDKKDNYKPKV